MVALRLAEPRPKKTKRDNIQLKLYLRLDAPFHWVLTNTSGEVADHGLEVTLDQVKVPAGVTEIVGIAPGQSVTTRSVLVPGRRRANVEAALPYALEESLSEDVEELHFTLMKWQPGQPADVAIVSEAQLQKWIDLCQEVSITLDRIVPEYLIVPLHTEDSCTICLLEDDSIYIRTGELTGFAMDREFFDYWLDTEDIQDRPISVTDAGLAKTMTKNGISRVSHWDIGNQLTDWIALAKSPSALEGLSLLHGNFAPKHRTRNFRQLKIAATCGMLAVVIYYVSMALEARDLRLQRDTINQQMVALFNQHFPGEPYLGRPRSQLQSLLASRGGSGNLYEFQRLLQVVTNTTRQHNAEIEEVNYRDRAMTVLCNVSSLSVLDNIRQTLQQVPGMRAELLSSGARDNKVTGRFRLERG